MEPAKIIKFVHRNDAPIMMWVQKFENIWKNQGKDAAVSFGRYQIPKVFWKQVNDLLQERSKEQDNDG